MEGVYGRGLMELYRLQGEAKMYGGAAPAIGDDPAALPSPTKNGDKKSPRRRITQDKNIPLTDDGQPIPKRYLHRPNGSLPPHVYQAADDAYRAMMRGIEMKTMSKGGGRGLRNRSKEKKPDEADMPINQSILCSGESGAGKTVTTKIILNYFAMLSQKSQEDHEKKEKDRGSSSAKKNEKKDVSIEQQVLQSNPILEAFGNARTIRNDNSSRFGKYINIAFTDRGQLLRASIDTYLLEKVRLIHQTPGERNFHVFYQFLEAATDAERDEFLLSGYTVEDFKMTNQSGTYDRRDGVDDVDMHEEMVEAMGIMKFGDANVKQLMRLVCAVLFSGNMTFSTQRNGEGAILDETEASLAVAQLLGVTFDNLAASLTSKVIFARGDMIHKSLDLAQAEKASEALIKSIYGAAFDFIADKINASINAGSGRMPAGGGGRPKPGRRQTSEGPSNEPLNIVPPRWGKYWCLGYLRFRNV